jgi:hypothetical protein
MYRVKKDGLTEGRIRNKCRHLRYDQKNYLHYFDHFSSANHPKNARLSRQSPVILPNEYTSHNR